jgi:ATP-dependent RNA helicase RhlE
VLAAARVESRGRRAGPPHTTTRHLPAAHAGRHPENQNNLTFEELGLSPVLLKTITEEGYTEPTPVQSRAIPLILNGRDVLAAAQTGTGKTAAFTLPILDRMAPYANTSFSPARHPVRCLVLTPTRELAVQVAEAMKTYSRNVPLRA